MTSGSSFSVAANRKGTISGLVFITLSFMVPMAASAQLESETPKIGDLKDIIVSAYEYHPQLKSLRAETQGSREILNEARANYLPQISLDGSLNASDRKAALQDGSRFEQNTTPQAISLRFNQTLYNGGRRALATRNATYTVKASEARYDTFATAIAAEIIQDYMSLLAAIAEVKALEESVAILGELEKSVLARQKVGDSTRTDVSQARSRLASARARRASSRAELTNARSRLLSKTGFLVENPTLPIEATVPILQDLDAIKSMARRNSPALKSSRLNEMSANLSLQSEGRKHLPTITLTANASSVRDSSPTIRKDDDLNIGLRFTMPIYTGGVGAAQTRRAAASFNAARYQYENTLRETDLRIEQFWSQLQSGVAVIMAQKSSVEASDDALTGVTRGEEVGLTSTQDIIDAAQNKLNADIALARAEYSQYTTRLLLKLYMGDFDVYDFK
ncbi:MAG: TolC family outer membrane protein [Hellea sp.]